MLYDKEYYGESLLQTHLIHKSPLSYRTINDCIALPSLIGSHGGAPLYECEGGLWDSDGNYIKGSYLRSSGAGIRDEGDDNDVPSLCENLYKLTGQRDFSNITHIKDTVIFLGCFITIWGHFITDGMRSLWFLMTKEYKEKFGKCPILYVPAIGEFHDSHKKLLEILGIDISLMQPVTEPVKLDKAILPDGCFFHNKKGVRFFTPEYAELTGYIRDFAAAHAKPEKSKKFYFSYSKYARGRVTGEDKLEKYFASKGYEIIYPEELSLDEQLNILANCESFASTVGSCSHNMLFLKDGTEVILIPRTCYIPEYQLAIDHVHNLNITYVDSSFSIFTDDEVPWGGSFLYFISSGLRKALHDEDTSHIISHSDFRKYFCHASGWSFNSSFGQILNPNNKKAYKYYSTIAPEYIGYIFSHSWPRRVRNVVKRIKRAILKMLGKGQATP